MYNNSLALIYRCWTPCWPLSDCRLSMPAALSSSCATTAASRDLRPSTLSTTVARTAAAITPGSNNSIPDVKQAMDAVLFVQGAFLILPGKNLGRPLACGMNSDVVWTVGASISRSSRTNIQVGG